MSSDDEDMKTTPKQYIVSQKPWRSLELKQFLRILDRLAILFKVEARGQSSGHRVDDLGRRSEGSPVRSLPSNAYLESWKASQENWQTIIFDIRADEVYDLTLPDWVMR